jgi:chorismate dehydratase
MNKIKISVVSYLNSKPFIYGLEHSDLLNEIDLQLDIPSVCASKLMNGTVDLGLIPSAAIPRINDSKIISDYCIGAVGKVASVMLYSEVPLLEIRTVLLDYQSNTSVNLVRILAKHFWKISPEWKDTSADYENNIKDTTAAVIIGDRTFGLDGKYKYSYDLAEEWQKFTGLPFVFACWVANKKLPEVFINKFNSALKFGLDNRETLIDNLRKQNEYNTDIKEYLTRNIDYNLDKKKREALKLFLEYIKEKHA